ncbi:MAG: Chromosome partitioning protein ParB [Candidatus Daviesbacteria bacterium GW2011_GWA2_38_24]|uniref:Chromosome partitioning protein ParB n=1 Tax=Candidatus Daviesbacteria bacterium GW2011_GWA2_38_24 TaxID=1618422 RepID=A0A0G0JK03_9BACT|nr:MAG: Chromosome partitioning protein ParB [Candidatus Daviesbacteria bacterium GW2011_GWA2_38_24]KKQ79187.1 MAG: Chromosome partitioning protein ParB [Candidatus Daviesbacteria bacterium GW2011_GWA1_38_7]
MDNQDERIFELEIDFLQSNPLQPRGLITPESLAELSESIREHGILEPIVVARTPAGFQIIAGERRWRASRLAGLKKVPVIIRETTPQGMLEMAIVENVQRIDLNPLERAQAYKRLMDEFGLINSEIAQRVSKSPSYISNTIRLLTLPDALKDAVMSGQTTEGHVRALCALEDPHLIIEGYKEVLRKSLSVRGTEELVRRMRSKHGVAPKAIASPQLMHIISEDVDRIQEGLTHVLANGSNKATKVKYILTGAQAKLEIKLDGQPEQTAEKIQKIYQAITSYFNSDIN